jgi:translocon-associated protein subunit alpha
MKTLAVLFLLLSSLFVVRGQDATEQEASSGDVKEEAVAEVVLSASPTVSTVFVFPEFPNRELVLGKEVEVLFGLSNSGDSPVNVTSISASLRYPSDWRYFIQNYTQVEVSVTVKPGEQHSFLYRFMPDPMLEAREFGLSAQVFYHDQEGNNFTSYFYNSTVSLIESSESIDAQTLFTYVGIVGVAGLVLFVIYKAVGDKKKTKRAPKLETGTQNTDVSEEWLEGTHARPKSPKGNKSPTKSRKVKDN